MTSDVVVIGSGLAGSASAIALARVGHRVTLFERRRLPAHKVCGEFLSPEVRRAIEGLGVLGAVVDSGAVPVGRMLITEPGGASFGRSLPGSGLGLSRYALDALLLHAAGRAGVRVIHGTAADSIDGSLGSEFTVGGGDFQVVCRAVIGAWGRRDRLDLRLGRRDPAGGSPWVAFKAHHRGTATPETVELHLFEGGYCGISGVEDGHVNVCWIVHRDALADAGSDPDRFVATRFGRNRRLGRRMTDLRRTADEWLSTSQLRFEPRAAFARDVCLVGDSAGMIAPLCGDGMAMAFDSAALAAAAIDRFLADGDAERMRRAYTTAWTDSFSRRMRIGRWLHRGLVRPRLAGAGLRVVSFLPAVGDLLVKATRGA